MLELANAYAIFGYSHRELRSYVDIGFGFGFIPEPMNQGNSVQLML